MVYVQGDIRSHLLWGFYRLPNSRSTGGYFYRIFQTAVAADLLAISQPSAPLFCVFQGPTVITHIKASSISRLQTYFRPLQATTSTITESLPGVDGTYRNMILKQCQQTTRLTGLGAMKTQPLSSLTLSQGRIKIL